MFLFPLSWPLKVKNPIAITKKKKNISEQCNIFIMESCKRLHQDNKEISHVSHTILSHFHFGFCSIRTLSCLCCVYFHEKSMRITTKSPEVRKSKYWAIKYSYNGVLVEIAARLKNTYHVSSTTFSVLTFYFYFLCFSFLQPELYGDVILPSI